MSCRRGSSNTGSHRPETGSRRRDKDRPVRQGRRRVEQPVGRLGDRTVRMERPPETHARQAARAVPRDRVGLDEYGQPPGGGARHVLDPQPLVERERGKIRAVDADRKEADSPEGPAIQRPALPAGEHHPPVRHGERIGVARRVEGQSAHRRTVEFRGVEMGGRLRPVFVHRAGGIADERQLVPGLGGDDRVERGLVSWAAAVGGPAGDLPGTGAVRRHLVDVPAVCGCPFAGEEDAFAVERDVRIARAVEPAAQHTGGEVGRDDEQSRPPCVGRPQHAARTGGLPLHLCGGGKLRDHKGLLEAHTLLLRALRACAGYTDGQPPQCCSGKERASDPTPDSLPGTHSVHAMAFLAMMCNATWCCNSTDLSRMRAPWTQNPASDATLPLV